MEGKLSKFSRMCLPYQDYSILLAIIYYMLVFMLPQGVVTKMLTSIQQRFCGVVFHMKRNRARWLEVL